MTSLKFNSNYKNLTVLVYANGNNDLEPEIYNGFNKIKEESIFDNINIIIQIARAPKELVKMLRYKTKYQSIDQWNGVRRYKIINKKANLIEKLGNINMADPNTLDDFIIWGITNFPSENIVLILSGHGAGFIGTMTDFTHDYPYIMSTKGLIHALCSCQQKTGRRLDSVVLDSCYMNMVEVWHELALTKNQPVKNLLAPLTNIPLEGLPCHLIIKYLQKNINEKISINETLSNTTKSVNKNYGILKNIQAINLTKSNFIKLKNQINEAADFIISNDINLLEEFKKNSCNIDNNPVISLLDLSEILAKSSTNYFNNEKLYKILKEIVIYPNINVLTKNQNLGPSIYLPQDKKQYFKFKNHYNNMLFTDENRWIEILGGNIINDKLKQNKNEININSLQRPLITSVESVVSLIIDHNPNFTIEKAFEIVKKIGWNKELFNGFKNIKGGK